MTLFPDGRFSTCTVELWEAFLRIFKRASGRHIFFSVHFSLQSHEFILIVTAGFREQRDSLWEGINLLPNLAEGQNFEMEIKGKSCVEPGCKIGLTWGAHRCPDCKGVMHGICGTGEGDKGFSQSRLCSPCASRRTENGENAYKHIVSMKVKFHWQTSPTAAISSPNSHIV